METLAMDPAFAQRNVNEGFSGGEKKRHEILQLELLKPKIAILDETDSGLDVDALRVVSEGVNRVPRDRRARRAADHALHAHPALHQARLRACLRGGRSLRRAARKLADKLEAEGYEQVWGTEMTTVTIPEGMPQYDDVPRFDVDRFAPTSRSWPGGQRHPLVYLDSANTSQKPRQVIDAMRRALRRHTTPTCAFGAHRAPSRRA
jgi:ABC-type cobalamin/Fe3+-siderophores transport system ATPase subunit